MRRLPPGVPLLLAWVAASVDAACYLGLGHVMTAAMTGNTVLLGMALGRADLPAAARGTLALAGFLGGALLGATIARPAGPRQPWPVSVTLALALELVLLVALAVVWQAFGGGPDGEASDPHLMILLAGLAMGLQGAAVSRLPMAGETTTFVTGTLTRLATGVVDARRRGARAERPSRTRWRAFLWLAYAAGATAAAIVKTSWPALGWGAERLGWGSAALALPTIALALVLVSGALRSRAARAANA